MPKINICKGKLMKYFYNPNNLKSKILSEGVVLKPMWGDNIMMNVVELEPGSEVPLHSHPNEQAGIVLEGEFEFTIGEEKKTVKKGEFYLIPGGIKHRVLTGNRPSKALDIFSPPREDYKEGLT